MGNDITKKYDMPPESSASGGPGRLWKLFPAQNKQTGMPVTVFVLEKDGHAFRKLDKAKAEQLFQVMRKDIKNLQAQGHGRILRVLEVFEENKKALAFVTERVVCSLADFHSRFEGIPSDRVANELRQMRFTEMEVGRGLYNIGEALQYLHNVGRRVHMDVCPENIFLSPQGQWKLGGLGFSLAMESGSTPSPYFVRDPERLPFRVEPAINYSAPEAVLGAVGRTVTPRADMFAVGLLAIEAFKAQSEGYVTPTRPVVTVPNAAPSMYDGALNASLGQQDLNAVPLNFRAVLTGLLAHEPSTRLDVSSMLSSPYFHTGGVALLCAIDTIQERDVPSQASFLSSLPAQLHMFEARILKHTILPTVCRACLHSPSLWDFGLAAIEAMTGVLTNDEFQKAAQPYFAKALTNPGHVDTIKAFVKHAHWIMPRVDSAFLRNSFLSAVLLAVGSTDSQVQIDALRVLGESHIIEDLDGATLEQTVVPAVCKASVKTQMVAVRVQALVVLSKTLTKLPQVFLLKAIVPTLKAVRQMDTTPAVAMCVLGCYERIAEPLGPEPVCNAILPNLLPLLYDKQLNAKQFEMVSARVWNMLAKILQARHTELGLPPPDMAVVALTPTVMQPEVSTPTHAPPPVPKKPPSIPSTPPVEPTADPFADRALADTMKGRAAPPIPSQPPSIPVFSPAAASSADIDALFANLEMKPAPGASGAASAQTAPSIAAFDPSDPFAGLSFADSPFASSSDAAANEYKQSASPFGDFAAPAPTPAPAPAPAPVAPAKQAPQMPKIAPPRDPGSTRLVPAQPTKPVATSAASAQSAANPFGGSGDLFSGLSLSPTGASAMSSAAARPLTTTTAPTNAAPFQGFPAASAPSRAAGPSSLDPFAGLDFAAPTAAPTTSTPASGFPSSADGFGGTAGFGMAPAGSAGFGMGQPSSASMNMGQGIPMGAAGMSMGFPMMGGSMPMGGTNTNMGMGMGMGMGMAPAMGMGMGMGMGMMGGAQQPQQQPMNAFGGFPGQPAPAGQYSSNAGQAGQWPGNMGFMQGFPPPSGQR